ncbi:hypothetical protein M514_00305 [Trichuris suis]|uniref:Uncharacterized protein n=1 Tax=Trichuris suis TaxID=68888 RepID=A0A085MN16_9BILA|nr:hypothetical protein M513_00305 [Trichuris suis]KFD68577.1 hypothetical protein M514_00305 [Trichuris suis]KHJ44015.1 Tat pathway signal sequence domain protein [Trichuris suis]
MKTLKRQRTFVKGVSAILLLLVFSGKSNASAAADKGSWIPVYPLIPLGQEVKHRSTTPLQQFTVSSQWEDREPVTHERLELDSTPFATPSQVVHEFEDTTPIQVIQQFEDTTPATVVSHVGGAGAAQVRLTSSDDFYAQYAQGEIAYINTSGREEGCQFHKDCYTSREPKEWCQLMKETHYS